MLKNLLLIFCLMAFSFSAMAQKKSELTENHICRAAISTLFDQKPEAVEVFRQQKNIIYLKFPQDENNKVTRFKCYVNGEEIVWATEIGAYRNTAIDSKITYETKNKVLTVKEKHKNGSVFSKIFDIQKFTTQK